MKILFIANTHMNIYKEIEEEIINQGHIVITIEDKLIKGDPYFINKSFIRKIKTFGWEKRIKKYWENRITKLDKHFDILFVISGTSINNWVIELIKKYNPNIKTVYYTWDNCSYYNYKRHLDYFDNSYTFDIEDASQDKRWSLLPIPCRINEYIQKPKYDFFLLGTNHSNRLDFYKKIYSQLVVTSYKYYIKLLATPISMVKTISDYIIRRDKVAFRKRNFSKGKYMKEILLKEPISPKKYNGIIQNSKCIIDDSRPGQSGLSARFMWALANRKKIITTNKWALEYSFVNPKQIRIIDSNNPKIPFDFIEEDKEELNVENRIINYTYTNWVKTILSI